MFNYVLEVEIKDYNFLDKHANLSQYTHIVLKATKLHY